MAIRTKIIIAGLSAIVVLGFVWKEVIEDRVVPKRWGVVEPDSIYRSGQLHPALVESTLVDNQIDVVVNMRRLRLDKPEQAAEDAVIDALRLTKERYPMGGNGTGDPENYALAVERVHRAVESGERVLVHCTAGSQRTGAVIALYRTLLQGRSSGEAIAEMEEYDFDPVDDEILLRFLDDNMGYLTRRLVEMSVLEGIPDTLPVFAAP